MCVGGSPKVPAAQPLPPTPPQAPTMADPAVQAARSNTQREAAQAGGLSSTQLTVNLGGQGSGNKRLGGTN